MAVELAVPSQTFWGVEIPPIQPWAIPRKHPRVPLVTQVESRATGAVSLGHTDNISVDGLFVLTPDTFDPGTEVIVRFNLRSGRPIEAAGNVVHSVCGVRMGIQFRRLKDEDRDMIAKFIQQASEEE